MIGRVIGRPVGAAIGWLALAGNGSGPASKCFECEENIHDAQARNRSTHERIVSKKGKRRVLIQKIVGLPDFRPRHEDQHQSQFQPDEEPHNSKQAGNHQPRIMGDSFRSGNRPADDFEKWKLEMTEDPQKSDIKTDK